MKLAVLTALNLLRAQRRPAVVITNLDNHQQRLVHGETFADDPLSKFLRDVFADGKSRVVESEGFNYFLDAHIPPARLYIIGAVHIAQTLAPMARMIELDAVVIDPREAFAAPFRFQNEQVLAQWPDEALSHLGLDRRTAVAALTHDPKIDDLALAAALNADCFYIGALGSRKSHARRLERLAAQNFSPESLSRLCAPIGLDIGAVSPAQIAVSILAEILCALRQKPLRSGEGA